jgi:predicted dehydrogenase
MSNPPLRLAVFGVGRWGVNLLRNFLALPEAEVIAVVDPRPAQLEQVRQQFELADTVVLTADWAAVMARSDLDGVVIATPAATHYELIRTALTQGKHVLAEKPLTLDASECETLCQLAEAHQRQLVIDHTYLFHPVVEKGRALIADQALGSLRYGYATRTNLGPVRQDVDALWDLAIHDIAIFNDWLGETPIAVQAHGQVWLQPGAAPLFPNGLADVVWVNLTYPSGFQATVHLCWANPDKQRRLCVVGDRGTLVMDELQPEPLVIQRGQFQVTEHSSFQPADLAREVMAIAPAEPLKQVCQHFLDCVRTQTPSSRSSGAMGTNLVKVLLAVSQSLATGQKLVLSPSAFSGQP